VEDEDEREVLREALSNRCVRGGVAFVLCEALAYLCEMLPCVTCVILPLSHW
jgi:hypothetical protein